MTPAHPHASGHILYAGVPVNAARAAVVLLHGRGGSAEDILSLTRFLPSENTAYLAPQARGNTWYPFSFLSPLEQNEPALSSALLRVQELLESLASAGIPRERIVLAGFSQGACLALESAVRHPAPFGGVVALSGGLIGPPGTSWQEGAGLHGVPVFLGCSDIDPHIPRERVAESARHFASLGAQVAERIYPGMGHTINEEELQTFADMIRSLHNDR
jgi:predicted esterase